MTASFNGYPYPGAIGSRTVPDPKLSARIFVEADALDSATLQGLVHRWLAEGIQAVGGPLWTELNARIVMPGEIARSGYYPGDAVGVHGEVWCHFEADGAEVRPEQWENRLEGAYTPESFASFLDDLGTPETNAGVYLFRIKQPTIADPMYQEPYISVYFESYEESGRRWIVFQCDGSTRIMVGPDGESRLLRFLHHFADEINSAYGEIHYSEAHCYSVLEAQIGLPEQQPREVLRGYGWLTVVPQEIGDRLGGLEALRASGAFYEVETLDNGGYWMLATPRFQDYDMEAATRVWTALAPALPPGVPKGDVSYIPPRLLVLADPRSVTHQQQQAEG